MKKLQKSVRVMILTAFAVSIFTFTFALPGMALLGNQGVAFAQEQVKGEETETQKDTATTNLKGLWAALAIGFCAFGTGWAQSRVGLAGGGAVAEKPETAGTIIVLIAIPETMVILGFVIAAMILLM